LVLPSPTSTAAENNSQEETAVEIPPEDTLEKIINAPVTKHHKKATQTVSAPLEVHQDASSSSGVIMPCALFFYDIVASLIHFHSAAFDAEIPISWR
jgi:hypothetical protein